MWAKRDWVHPAAAAPDKSANQYSQCESHEFVMIAGPNTRAGLKAPPETEPPIKQRNPRVNPIAIGANPAFELPEVVY